MKDLILKWALKNAVEHEGKAQVGAVIPKVIGERPELKSKVREIAKEAAAAVKEVNSLSPEEQRARLQRIAPELLEIRKAEERKGLPDLPGAEKGKVVLRLPPEPSGYMHLGHAMAGLINSLYRERYNGKLWLRFEDTNPKKVRKEFFDSFKEGYRWLGISWDAEKRLSEDMEHFYKYAEKLISKGKVYVCTCDDETIKKNRSAKKACRHKSQSASENKKHWMEMLAKKFSEGKAVLRYNGDMKSLDASLRDPNLFRIIDAKHVFTGDTYSVWPAYDFAVVVEDHLCKITHVLRSQEFHTALQEVLRKDLGFAGVEIVQFSRFNFKGTPFSKREIRPLIEKKIIKDWDDPRLPTVAAAKRRGFLPEAIREFTVQVGYGKAEHTFDWELFYAVNRKLLDPISRRLFFVPDPVALRVEKAPLLKVKLDFHPENDLGHRELETAGSFFIPEADAESLKPGEIFRLKDLYNVKLTKTGKTGLAAEYAGKELVPGTKKVQWTTSKEHAAEVVVPDVLFTESGEYNRKSLAISKGCIEPSVAMVKVGEVVQLERFGFARLDEKGKVLKFIFTHK